jgi:hypothetical protein
MISTNSSRLAVVRSGMHCYASSSVHFLIKSELLHRPVTVHE